VFAQRQTLYQRIIKDGSFFNEFPCNKVQVIKMKLIYILKKDFKITL